ncbi:glycosyltransferase family 2 protein [Biomaibacter acetigenes]|jgi:glycosyltransferase involved in cell wall biosynthesis|uniref:Glucosyl-3-phosphoglycerate synthase n=1 Tax=Biomaibacter acetigenes TaxID=2316383 RepID=A0A3G2R4Y0_9FIRM|nr:glycosyltransferase family 2 protein [Biomaibacter acetigenes]AYO30506.1 glycosyltransferase family 2 protein [Biomaibacter acetigenes]
MSVAAIIPAYNEGKTIGNVLKVLMAMKDLDEVIVVNDGSGDNTATVARNYNARVVDLPKNSGKSIAVLTGVKNTQAEIILMLDADLVGLKELHVRELLQPVYSGEAAMTIGIFKNGRGATDLAQRIAPFLSGQRALKRDVFDKLEKYSVKDYGLEIALTLMAERENIRVREVELRNLTHVMKEEKRGLLAGFLSRIKMYWDIIYCVIKFRLEVF